MVTPAHGLNDLVKAAYAVTKVKGDALKAFRQMPGMVKWFQKSEFLQQVGYLQAMEDFFPKKEFFRVDLDYGSGRADVYIVRDVKDVETYLLEQFPTAVAHQVMHE